MSPVEMQRDDERKPENERLEQVFDTADESEAFVVRGLLQSNGIECLETALDAPQDVLPGVGGIATTPVTFVERTSCTTMSVPTRSSSPLT